jgi:shikimate dehydrogenase
MTRQEASGIREHSSGVTPLKAPAPAAPHIFVNKTRNLGIALPSGFSGCIVGLAGRAIGSSRSPAMHEREASAIGIPYAYTLIDFDHLGLDDAQLPEVITEAEALGFAGLNVTHPFKQSVIACLDDLSPEARAISAVNTVLLRGGQRIGHNTDSWGFAASFAEELAGVPTGAVVMFGAGGAGAAVAHALLQQGVGHLILFDLQPQKADVLAGRLNERFGPRVEAARSIDAPLRHADGVVNATPMGMAKYPGLPFAAELLHSRQWVAEIVYFPRETELLRAARAIGCRTLAGTGMAIYQAMKSFELFTGVTPDRTRMIAHFGENQVGSGRTNKEDESGRTNPHAP